MSRLSEELPEKYAKDISQNEKIVKAICGANKKTWLVCTDKGVYVLKYGFLNNHAFGSGIWRTDYSQISSVNLDWHIMGACTLSVLTSSMPQTVAGTSTFSERATQARIAPNVIACYATKEAKSEYQKMVNYINEQVANSRKTQTTSTTPQADLAGEMAKLASLHEQGILNDDEFTTAKAKLLES